MSTQHTPGPWHFYTEPQPNGCPIVGSGGTMVAMLAHSIHHQEYRKIALANARLIAAAPEMLEGLKAVDAALADPKSATRKGYLTRTIKQVREAIEKAEGGAQ